MNLCFSERLDAVRKQFVESVADNISLGIANIRLRDNLRAQALRDPLTGLYNRRHLNETFERELQRCARNKRPLTVWIIDVDHFKDFNDENGHDAGDEVLAAVAKNLKQQLRFEDMLCRWGGEEFVAILPEMGMPLALERAQAAIESVARLSVYHQHQALPQVTISLGVAVFPKHGSTTEVLIRAADQALYNAKEDGRNQVQIFPDTSFPPQVDVLRPKTG